MKVGFSVTTLTTKNRIHASVLFPIFMQKNGSQIRHFYTPGELLSQNPRTTKACSFNRQSVHGKNIRPSEKRKFIDELLKLSKIGALKYEDMKTFLT